MRPIKHPEMSSIELTEIMHALSDPARMDIVKSLAGVKSMTCGELNKDRPKSSMSHHFKILRDAGVIETRVEGKEHFNSLRLADMETRFPGILRSILKNL
jgi:DNA-binding transcriptional ArsR family regulator